MDSLAGRIQVGLARPSNMSDEHQRLVEDRSAEIARRVEESKRKAAEKAAEKKAQKQERKAAYTEDALIAQWQAEAAAATEGLLLVPSNGASGFKYVCPGTKGGFEARVWSGVKGGVYLGWFKCRAQAALAVARYLGPARVHEEIDAFFAVLAPPAPAPPAPAAVQEVALAPLQERLHRVDGEVAWLQAEPTRPLLHHNARTAASWAGAPPPKPKPIRAGRRKWTQQEKAEKGNRWSESEKELLRVLDAEATVAGMDAHQRKRHILRTFAKQGVSHTYAAAKAQRARLELHASTERGLRSRRNLCAACGQPRKGHICPMKLAAERGE